MWSISISEINFSVSSIRKKISYRRHVHHNPSITYASRCWAKRKWLHVLWDSWNHFLKFERIEQKTWKHSAEKYHDLTMKFIHSAVELTLLHTWVCLHHTFAIRNLILRCLKGSHMTILSKSNGRVRLNVNMDIADSISFYLNFGKSHYFVLRLKQHFFEKARLFKILKVNPAIVDWSEEERETCARRSLSFESFVGKAKSLR